MESFDNVKRRIDKIIQEYKAGKDAHLFVATLIATVTFAAGFTLPDGFENDDSKNPHDPIKKGYAVLSESYAFIVFFITDTIIFLASMSVILMHFILTIQSNKRKIYWLSVMNIKVLPCALFTLAVAFSTAVYVVLPYSYPAAFMNFALTAIAILIWCILIEASYYLKQVKSEDMVILGSFGNFLLRDSHFPLIISGKIILPLLTFVGIILFPLEIVVIIVGIIIYVYARKLWHNLFKR